MKNLFTLIFSITFYFSATAQCSVREIPLSSRASASSLIVEGKVISKNSFWNSNNTMIYTSNVVEVYKIFKGEISSTSIEILTEGGTVGMNMVRVEPSLELNVDDIGIFTCEIVSRVKANPVSRSGIPQYEAFASIQGFVKYDLRTQTASDAFRVYNNIENEVYAVVLPSTRSSYRIVKAFDIHSTLHNGPNPNVQAPTISGFSPTTITSGTGTVLTINGSGFGAIQGAGSVGFKNADDGGSTYINPLATQILTWSNTQITVEVPTKAGTGTIQVTQAGTATSATNLTVSYAHLNVTYNPGSGNQAYQTDHVNDNAAGGYTWRMNTAFDADVNERASFMRAFDSWRCETGVNWIIGATTSINDALGDGINVICNDNTAPLPAGVLGTCYSYWSGCNPGSGFIWYVSELDIIFDDGSNITPLTWEYGPANPTPSEYDFETVAVHELGHGHQLGHVILNGQIMHYAISNGTANRSLDPDDIAGGNYVQAKSIVANACGSGAMTNYSCAAIPVADFSGTPTTLCEGGTVAFTDLSTNTPTSWSWVFQGGTPSTSTSQNPTITYNTAGTYSVTLTATNASGSDAQSYVGYITVNDNPIASASSQTNISCNAGSDGSATVSVSGGTPAFVYNWTPGNPTGDGTVTVTGLTAATWTCTVTDANSCTDSQAFTITQPSALSCTPSQSNISCNGGANGSATVSMSGGTPSYTYSWSPTGGTAATAGSLFAGTYTCTVTDANGCILTQTFNVTQPVALTAAKTQINVSCFGGSNGSGTVIPAGGTSPYTYVWTPFGGTGATSTPLVAGSYVCTITDANGCSIPKNFLITQPTPITSTPSQVDVTCNAGNDGSATVIAGGGVGPYTYSWAPSGGTAATASSLSAGTYTCTITDASSCTLSQTFAITEPIAISIVMSHTDENCSGADGTATATPSGGNAPYTYLWSPGGQTTQTATALTAATYTCTVTDNIGCSNSNSVVVANPSCGNTRLQPAYCGITLTALNQHVYCIAVSGATNYQYKFMQGATTIVTYTRGNYLTNCDLTVIPILRYGQTYQVTVRAYVGSAWGSFGTSCNVTTPAFPPGSVSSSSCGTTVASFSSPIYCNTVIGATNYQWKFMQGPTQIALYQRGNWLTDCVLANVSGVTYGQTYDVYVRAKEGGVWGPYGTSCTISTPAFPTTQVAPTWCNGSVSNLSSGLTCNPLLGATNYKWKVENGTFSSTGYRGSSQTDWRLSWNTGTTINTTYSVSISALVGGVWGPFGPICTVSVGPYYLPPYNDRDVALPPEVRIENQDLFELSNVLALDVYPNPFSENITVTTDVAVKNISIYNSLGELVRIIAIENGTAEIKLGDLPSGIYLVQAQTVTGTVTKRIIKQ